MVVPVALLVLLGQVVLPQLHAAQTGSHAAAQERGPRTARFHRDATVALEQTAVPSDSEHSESRCPVCQTLAHAHDFLPTTSCQPGLPDAGLGAEAPRHAARRSERLTACAPRSPPLAA